MIARAGFIARVLELKTSKKRVDVRKARVMYSIGHRKRESHGLFMVTAIATSGTDSSSLKSTTSSLESMLAKPKNITLADYAYMERAFVQKLNEAADLLVQSGEELQGTEIRPCLLSDDSTIFRG